MQETTYFNNQKVHLEFLNFNQFGSLNLKDIKITSVHCFPIKDDKVLFTKNQRGIDIIGGHVEPGETITECLLRESLEEACIHLNHSNLLGAIKVDNRDNPIAIEKGYPIIGYQLFFASHDFHLDEFVQTHECTERVFLTIYEVMEQHHHWLNIHDKLLSLAFLPPHTLYTSKSEAKKARL